MEIKRVIPSGYCKGVVNAINIVKKAKKDSPFYTQAVFTLARLYEKKDMISQAIKNYKKISELKSDNGDDYSNLATSRLMILENKDNENILDDKN